MAFSNRLTPLIISLIGAYQVVSRYLPPRCRFYPSCSNYMREAIDQYGLLMGLYKGLSRMAKCHPLHPGGYDPLPR